MQALFLVFLKYFFAYFFALLYGDFSSTVQILFLVCCAVVLLGLISFFWLITVQCVFLFIYTVNTQMHNSFSQTIP